MKTLRSTPASYLDYVRQQADADPNFRQQCQAELDRRRQESACGMRLWLVQVDDREHATVLVPIASSTDEVRVLLASRFPGRAVGVPEVVATLPAGQVLVGPGVEVAAR